MTYSEQIKNFSMDFFSLKGKTAIVTGANKGSVWVMLWLLPGPERIFL